MKRKKKMGMIANGEEIYNYSRRKRTRN